MHSRFEDRVLIKRSNDLKWLNRKVDWWKSKSLKSIFDNHQSVTAVATMDKCIQDGGQVYKL